MSRLAGSLANTLVGQISGVSETDTKVEAAQKAIAVMKLAGMNTKKAEQMLADYRAREGI